MLNLASRHAGWYVHNTQPTHLDPPPLHPQVGPSKVAGRGVFALLHIEAGTVIGSYPGRPRTPVG